MIGWPFDSQVTFDSNGVPSYDRAIVSKALRQLLSKLLTNGIMLNPSSNLQVTAGTGMNVIVKPGFCVIEGGLKIEEAERTLAVQASDTTYDRIDSVVMRLNDDISVRGIDLYVLKGTPSTKPVRPALTRTEVLYEIGLADIFVAKNTGAISQTRITDTRLDNTRCGQISALYEFDTTTLYNQINSDLADFKAGAEEGFLDWFGNLQNILDGNTAGHLQNEIGDLNLLETDEKRSLVLAINWLLANMATTAADVSYSPADTTWGVTNAKAALDSLRTDGKNGALYSDTPVKIGTYNVNGTKKDIYRIAIPVTAPNITSSGTIKKNTITNANLTGISGVISMGGWWEGISSAGNIDPINTYGTGSSGSGIYYLRVYVSGNDIIAEANSTRYSNKTGTFILEYIK